MVTHAEVKVEGPGRATLAQSGKQLGCRVLEPADAAVKIYQTDPPPTALDARNDGTRLIGFEVKVPAGRAQRVVVELVPQSAKSSGAAVEPLAQW